MTLCTRAGTSEDALDILQPLQDLSLEYSFGDLFDHVQKLCDPTLGEWSAVSRRLDILTTSWENDLEQRNLTPHSLLGSYAYRYLSWRNAENNVAQLLQLVPAAARADLSRQGAPRRLLSRHSVLRQVGRALALTMAVAGAAKWTTREDQPERVAQSIAEKLKPMYMLMTLDEKHWLFRCVPCALLRRWLSQEFLMGVALPDPSYPAKNLKELLECHKGVIHTMYLSHDVTPPSSPAPGRADSPRPVTPADPSGHEEVALLLYHLVAGYVTSQRRRLHLRACDRAAERGRAQLDEGDVLALRELPLLAAELRGFWENACAPNPTTEYLLEVLCGIEDY